MSYIEWTGHALLGAVAGRLAAVIILRRISNFFGITGRHRLTRRKSKA